MARTDGGWTPTAGLARSAPTARRASRRSTAAPIDLYLLHAPDPRVEWTTSVRALRQARGRGSRRASGRVQREPDTARRRLRARADRSRAGRAEPLRRRRPSRRPRRSLCRSGLALIAHSPLGGTRRAARLAHDPTLNEIAQAHDATEAEVALAWVLGLGPNVVAMPGARRPETARSAARAASLELGASERRSRRRPAPQREPSEANRRRRAGDGHPGSGEVAHRAGSTSSAAT